jgi:sialic acid synthase SpsE
MKIMSQIILDFGSGNTHKNKWDCLKRMIDELKAIDTGKHEIIIKHQLFKVAGDNLPLDPWVFDAAYDYAKKLGYKTASSVFDKPSLDFLLKYDIPFVKIANRRDLDWLIGEVPRKTLVYISHGKIEEFFNSRYQDNIRELICVSEYPSNIEKYQNIINEIESLLACKLNLNISDHTIGLDLFKKYKPQIWEKHYKLNDSTGLDAGPFAITPEELSEIL